MPVGPGTRPFRTRLGEMTEAALFLAAVVSVHFLVLLSLSRPSAPARSPMPIVVDLLPPPPVVQPRSPQPGVERKAQPPRVVPAVPRPVSQAPRPAAGARPRVKAVTAPAVTAPSATPSRPVARARSAAAESLDASLPDVPMTPAAPAASKPGESALVADDRGAPRQPLVPPRFDAPHLRNPSAEYPRLARRMGEQGRVMLRVFVSPVGAAEKVEIESSSGSPRLDQAALDAVARWKFVPARQGETDVGAWLLVPVVFRLDG